MKFKQLIVFVLAVSFGFFQSSNAMESKSAKKKMSSEKSEADKSKKKDGEKTKAKQSCDDFKRFKDVGMKEMKEIVKNGFSGSSRILDVNSLNSFNRSNIKGSHHFKTLVAKKTLAKVLGPDKNVSIVVYCGGKKCMAWQKAAKKACQMGYKNIRHFSEGISGWDKMIKSEKG